MCDGEVRSIGGSVLHRGSCAAAKTGANAEELDSVMMSCSGTDGAVDADDGSVPSLLRRPSTTAGGDRTITDCELLTRGISLSPSGREMIPVVPGLGGAG